MSEQVIPLAAGCHYLDLEGLEHFDQGSVAVLWKRCLEVVLRDCQNRPTVSNDRKISLELLVSPKTRDDGPRVECIGLGVRVRCNHGVPKFETAAVDVAIVGKAGRQALVFHDQAVEDGE